MSNMCEHYSVCERREYCKDIECSDYLSPRPRGEWEIKNTYYDYRAKSVYAEFACSCCGCIRSFYEIPETYREYYKDNFCPVCGAKMRG